LWVPEAAALALAAQVVVVVDKYDQEHLLLLLQHTQ
jgi:hypothetical protein